MQPLWKPSTPSEVSEVEERWLFVFLISFLFLFVEEKTKTKQQQI